MAGQSENRDDAPVNVREDRLILHPSDFSFRDPMRLDLRIFAVVRGDEPQTTVG